MLNREGEKAKLCVLCSSYTRPSVWRAELWEQLKKEELSWEPGTNHQQNGRYLSRPLNAWLGHSVHTCNSCDFLGPWANRITDEGLHLANFETQLLLVLQNCAHVDEDATEFLVIKQPQ